MEDELISKKELLEKYSISYGALYRWKRMGLIPEEWFLRRSAPTGQETFFRREQICRRIELIRDKKEELSLEELAASLEEHRQAGRTVRKLVVETVQGRREYRMEDIRELYLEENGKKQDLTEYWKEISL